jgi:hypothetical protein
LSADGQYLAMNWQVLDQKLRPTVRIDISAYPDNVVPAAFSDDGNSVFHLYRGYIYQSRLSDGVTVARFATGAPGFIWQSPAGRLVTTQVINDASTKISVIDLTR